MSREHRIAKLEVLSNKFPATFRGLDIGLVEQRAYPSPLRKGERKQIKSAIEVAQILNFHHSYVVQYCVLVRPDPNHYLEPSFSAHAQAYEQRDALSHEELVQLFLSWEGRMRRVYEPLYLSDGIIISGFDTIDDLRDYSSAV